MLRLGKGDNDAQAFMAQELPEPSWPLSYARALGKHVDDDHGGDGPLQPSPGRGQHEGHPLGLETSRLHKKGNACSSQTPGGGGGGGGGSGVGDWCCCCCFGNDVNICVCPHMNDPESS